MRNFAKQLFFCFFFFVFFFFFFFFFVFFFFCLFFFFCFCFFFFFCKILAFRDSGDAQAKTECRMSAYDDGGACGALLLCKVGSSARTW